MRRATGRAFGYAAHYRTAGVSTRALGVFLMVFLLGSGTATAGPFDAFVSVDAETLYFRNADGVFFGYGINYNQWRDEQLICKSVEFDLDVLRADLAQIAAMGFTHVVFRMEWGSFTPGEGRDPVAAYAQWQRMLDMVRDHGLYAEIWFDTWTWPEGMTIEDKWHIVLVDDFWESYLGWVGEVTAHFNDRTEILAWRSENESLPVRQQARHQQHPALLARFRRALEDHYGSVSALNKTWGTEHAAFGDVPLPGEGEDATAAMVDYNVLFHEPFVIERNQELARVVRQSDPNHLLIISGIGAVGGRAGTLFEVHDVDKLTGFDICGNGLYGDFPPQGVGSTLHYARTLRKFMSLGKPAMVTEVGMGEYGGQPARHRQRDWILAHLADARGAGGTAIDIWDYVWITDAIGGRRSTDNVPCRDVAAFIRATKGAVFAQERPEVLILKTKAEDYAAWPWRCHGNAQMLGDFLYQLHVPYDVFTDANVTAERLAKYRFVFVPSQTTLIDEGVWRLVADWLEGEPGRGLAVGLFEERDAHLRVARPPATMLRLMGLPVDYAYETLSVPTAAPVYQLRFVQPYGRFKPDDTLPFRPGGTDFLWAMPERWADSAVTIATLAIKTGTAHPEDLAHRPVLVENALPNGSRVYSFGTRLGLVSWALDQSAPQPVYDAMGSLYAVMLEHAGVTPVYDAPANVGVYIAADDGLVIAKERLGTAADDVVRSERLGHWLYTDAYLALAEGAPPCLQAAIPPRGVRVFRRVPVEVAAFTGDTRARIWSYSPQETVLEAESAHPCAFAVHGLEANAAFDVAITNAVDRTVGTPALDADSEGCLAIELRAGGRHFVCVRLRSAKE